MNSMPMIRPLYFNVSIVAFSESRGPTGIRTSGGQDPAEDQERGDSDPGECGRKSTDEAKNWLFKRCKIKI